MASMEELATRWTSIKKIQLGNMFQRLDFDGIMGVLKNPSAVPIAIRTTDMVNADYHFEWNSLIAAEDTEVLLLPGETIGPIFLTELYIKATYGTASLLVIEKEMR